MTIYIDHLDEFRAEPQGISLVCPHCQTLTHLTAQAAPTFATLSHLRPKNIGVVFRCDACAEPVFLKFSAKAYTPQRVELSGNFTEIERPQETFPLTYLPEESAALFKEALGCYAASCFNAFGAMCRRTAQSLFRELGEAGKLGMFDTLQEIRTLVALDDATLGTVRSVLFGNDSDPWPHQPMLDAESAGVLLEVMRDMLYQTFVRKERLLQAMTFRRFVTPAPAFTAAPAFTPADIFARES
jgi:hypothetical protein